MSPCAAAPPLFQHTCWCIHLLHSKLRRSSLPCPALLHSPSPFFCTVPWCFFVSPLDARSEPRLQPHRPQLSFSPAHA